MTDNVLAWAVPRGRRMAQDLEKAMLAEQRTLQRAERSLRDSVRTQARRVAELEEQLAARDATIEQLRAQLEGAQTDLTAEQREVFRLKVENSSLAAVRVDLEEQLVIHKAQVGMDVRPPVHELASAKGAEVEATKTGLRLMAAEMSRSRSASPARRHQETREEEPPKVTRSRSRGARKRHGIWQDRIHKQLTKLAAGQSAKPVVRTEAMCRAKADGGDPRADRSAPPPAHPSCA